MLALSTPILLLILLSLSACLQTTFYTVTFDSAGGSAVESVTVKEGEVLGELPVPEKTGAIFSGWTLNGGVYDGTMPVRSSITLKAEWNAEIHSVTFIASSEVILVQNIVHGESATAPTPPEVEGYYFTGWDTDYSSVTEDLVVRALYDVLQVTLALVPDGGVIDTLETIKAHFLTDYQEATASEFSSASDAAICQALTNELSNYKWLLSYFASVNPDKAASFTALKNATSNEEDEAIVANELHAWVKGLKEGASADYTSASVNEEINAFYEKHVTFTFGEEIALVPLREGYDFLGWYSGGRRVVSATQAEVLHARWRLNDESAVDAIHKTINDLEELFSTSTLYDDITLPNDNVAHGTTITWQTSDESHLDVTGCITPDLVSSHEVTLTATITLRDVKESYSVTLEVARGDKLPKSGLVTTYAYPNSSRLTTPVFTGLDIVYIAFESFTSAATLATTAIDKLGSSRVTKAHEAGCRVVMSIQSTRSDDKLTTISQSESLTTTLVANIIAYLEAHKLDGIDIDWEWPESGDATYYTSFMKKLYEALKAKNPYWLITSAIPGINWYKYYDLANSYPYHDYINLMTYEMEQESRGTFQSALYSSSKSSYYYNKHSSIDATMAIWEQQGVDLSLVLAGIPFYTRAFTDCAGMGKSASGVKAISYSSLLANYASLSTYSYTFDQLAGVPYAVETTSNRTFSFDDPTSIALKAQYAATRGLAGLMAWQLGQDNSSLDLLNAMKNNVVIVE